MHKNNPWISEAKKTVTSTKHFLSGYSVKVRTDQYNIFRKLYIPDSKSLIADVGVSSDETFKDANMFEKLYPWQNKLTILTIENDTRIRKLFSKAKIIKIKPGQKLPFKKNRFDVVVAWATLEHVGGFKEQKEFLKEISRIGKKFFITTPYRGCIYEPHSGFFLLHWLPISLFRKICSFTGKEFWSKESNLNPLYVRDILKIKPSSKTKVIVYKMFGIIPSHLLIYAK